MTRNILLVIKFTFIYAALSIIVDVVVVAAAVAFRFACFVSAAA